MIALTDVNVAKDWREGIRASACARFSTVLGPGSDGDHEEHIHLDLAERHAGYKMCEWDVREPIVQAKKTEPETEKAGIAPEAENATIAGPVPLPVRVRPLRPPRRNRGFGNLVGGGGEASCLARSSAGEPGTAPGSSWSLKKLQRTNRNALRNRFC